MISGKVFDAEKGGELSSLPEVGLGATFAGDGIRAASYNINHVVKLWDVASGRLLRELKGHTAVIQNVAFNPEGTLLASASMDRSVRLWDLAESIGPLRFAAHAIPRFSHPNKSILAWVACPGGGPLLSFGEDRALKRWELSSGRELRTVALALEAHPDREVAAFSPKGNLLAVRLPVKQRVQIWGTDPCVLVQELDASPSPGGFVRSHSLAFDRDGSRLAIAETSGLVKVWDLGQGRLLHQLGRPARYFATSVNFSPDGRLLAASLPRVGSRIWEVDTARELATIKELHAPLAFGPGGRELRRVPDGDLRIGRQPALGGHREEHARGVPRGRSRDAARLQGVHGHDREPGVQPGRQAPCLRGQRSGRDPVGRGDRSTDPPAQVGGQRRHFQRGG